MAGLFDSILDSIQSIDADDLWDAVGAGGKAYGESQKNNPSASEQLKMLKEGVDTMSYNQSNSTAGNGRALESVDPDSLNNIWRSRLRSFTSTDTGTDVKPR